MSHVSHVKTSCHVSDVNVSCLPCEWVMSPMWMSHMSHVNESCLPCESHHVSHVKTSCRVSHVNHVMSLMSHVSHVNESCLPCEWVKTLPRGWSCPPCGWVMSPIWMSHAPSVLTTDIYNTYTINIQYNTYTIRIWLTHMTDIYNTCHTTTTIHIWLTYTIHITQHLPYIYNWHIQYMSHNTSGDIYSKYRGRNTQ